MKVWSRGGAAAFLFATIAVPATAIAADSSFVSQHTRRSTAFVSARVDDRSQAVGAGVIIAVSPNVIVLTARHLAGRKNLALHTYSGEDLRIVAEYEVADRDLALIVASGPCTGCEAAETADAVTIGEPIHVWGNPQGRPYTLSAGSVVDLHPNLPGFATNGRFALACDTCDVGDSGAGVFDQRGRLLGIVTEGWDGLSGTRKRVIAEPANQAAAHLPLAYIAQTGPPPSAPIGGDLARSTAREPLRNEAARRTVGLRRDDAICGDSNGAANALALDVNGPQFSQTSRLQAESRREAKNAAREVLQDCRKATRYTQHDGEVIAMQTVRRGSTGQAVWALQYLLSEVGNAIPDDGVFGAETEAAVKGFQSAHGLTADGIAGPRTWSALKSAFSAAHPSRDFPDVMQNDDS